MTQVSFKTLLRTPPLSEPRAPKELSRDHREWGIQKGRKSGLTEPFENHTTGDPKRGRLYYLPER